MSESLSYNSMLLALHSLSLYVREQKTKSLQLQTGKTTTAKLFLSQAGGHRKLG